MIYTLEKVENGYTMTATSDVAAGEWSQKTYIFTTMKEVADWLVNNG